MNRHLAQLLTSLYPRSWRERYGGEFTAFLEDGRGGLTTWVNVAWSALGEHISPTRGGTMEQPRDTFGMMVRRPSAFLPLAMSIAAVMVVAASAIYGFAHGAHGIIRQPDEGAAAHLWQLLMAGQLLVLVFFAIKWLPRSPRQTMYVLGLQAGAVLAAMAPVYFLHL